MKLLYTILDTDSCNILIASNYKEIINLWIKEKRHQLSNEDAGMLGGTLNTPSFSAGDLDDSSAREYQLDTVSAAVNNPEVASGLEYRNRGYILSVH